jgi:succinate-acetate transporter protein
MMPDSIELQEYTIVEKHESWTSAGPVLSHISDDDTTAFRERAVIATASPAAFGWWAFATATWMSATVLGGYLPWSNGLSAAPTVLFFGGMAQFIAGLYGFRRANALQATAFTSFGMFNAALGMMLLLQVIGAVSPRTGLHELLGFLLESFAFIALALAWASLRRNATLFCLLATLCIGYCLAGVAQFLVRAGAAANGAGVSGGELGTVAAAGAGLMLASAFCAYYLGLAMLVNSTWNRQVLPLVGVP